jgi:hypothetical protein
MDLHSTNASESIYDKIMHLRNDVRYLESLKKSQESATTDTTPKKKRGKGTVETTITQSELAQYANKNLKSLKKIWKLLFLEDDVYDLLKADNEKPKKERKVSINTASACQSSDPKIRSEHVRQLIASDRILTMEEAKVTSNSH